MFRQDKVLTGVVTGLLFPVIIFVLVWEINNLLVEKRIMPNEGFRLQFLCIISVVANVLPAGSYVRAKKDMALRGIAGVTLLLVFGILIYFNKGLLGG